jgi:uncharacterized membrane-anchored protein
MKRLLAIIVILAQIGALAYMAGEREWISHYGRRVYLRTAPVDPRDPMRGDYVRFDYEVAHIPARLCQDGAAEWLKAKDGRAWHDLRDRVVYVRIETDGEGIATVVGASDKKPSELLFLRGRVESATNDMLHVRFGAEAMFTEQGKAAKFEQAARDRPGVPIEAQVAVGGSGIAVLQNYRWEPLGLTVELDRPPRPAAGGSAPARGTAVGLRGATVQLKNHSDHDVAIVVRPNGGSFRLVRNERWGETHFFWTREDALAPTPTTVMVRVLRAGETYREHIDLTQPEWYVRDLRKPHIAAPISLESLNTEWGASFRFEYVAVDRSEAGGLPHGDVLWHARIQSRSFTPAGSID